MTPTTDFAAQGLLQQLQPSIMTLFGALLTIAVVVWLIRRSFAKAQAEGGITKEEAVSIRRNTNWGVSTLVILILIVFAWHTVTTVAINRMPHSELDGSAVYDQMQKNIQPKQ